MSRYNDDDYSSHCRQQQQQQSNYNGYSSSSNDYNQGHSMYQDDHSTQNINNNNNGRQVYETMPHDFAASNDALNHQHGAVSSRPYQHQQQHRSYQSGSDDNNYGDSSDYSSQNLAGAARSGGRDGGASRAAASPRVQRDQSNPYAANSSNNGGGKMRSSKKKMFWIIGVLTLLALGGAGAGIAVWRMNVASANNKLNAAAAAASSGSTTGSTSAPLMTSTTMTAANGAVTVAPVAVSLIKIPGTAGAVLSNPRDPSQFQKDPRLHRSFYGLAYTPFNAQEPSCGATQANITEDLQIISQLTTRIRMYGSACNQSDLVLQAIQDAKLDLTVWLGVYIGVNETVNTQQMTAVIAALQLYGTAHVSGVTVGNEYILNSLASGKVAAVRFLNAKMATFRTMLISAGFPGIPVGTADAGSEITTLLATGSDFIMANVHPFFGGLPIAQAAEWTWQFFQDEDMSATLRAPNKPLTYIAETGWPTTSMTVAEATLGSSVAGIPQLQEFLDTYPCQANSNGTMYFFFETFDEPWKTQYGGVEPYWGVFTADKVLKAGITIPNCVSA